MTRVLNVNGDSTAYGATSGAESFVLNGYQNTILLAGASDAVSLAGGGSDQIDLNATGFTSATTDSVDLGTGIYDSILSSNALQDAKVSIANGYGKTDINLVNHGGSTSIALGNLGDLVNQAGLGLNDIVTLNGDATNTVVFLNEDGAAVAIGSAHDGLTQFSSTVDLAGTYNMVSGGDENFTLADQAGLNTISLGDGTNSLQLGGDQNNIVLGNGANSVGLTGLFDVLSAGTGNNTVTAAQGHVRMQFAAGGAGSTDTLTLGGNGDTVHGGDENFVVTMTARGGAHVRLGDGTDRVTIGTGAVTLGSTDANQASNDVTIAAGRGQVTLNGGTDQVNLQDSHIGYDKVALNGTMLGTSLTAHGSFDSVTLTADANAAITETTANGGLTLTINGDALGGMGAVSVIGLAQDNMAHINLGGLGAYTVSVDAAPAGGLTLHFDHGSLDLVGLQSISNHLITA
jgi:hypothetical protein